MVAFRSRPIAASALDSRTISWRRAAGPAADPALPCEASGHSARVHVFFAERGAVRKDSGRRFLRLSALRHVDRSRRSDRSRTARRSRVQQARRVADAGLARRRPQGEARTAERDCSGVVEAQIAACIARPSRRVCLARRCRRNLAIRRGKTPCNGSARRPNHHYGRYALRSGVGARDSTAEESR